MRYDAIKHVSTREMASLLGVPIEKVAGALDTLRGPLPVGKAVVNSRVQRIYDRAAVMEWVEKRNAQGKPLSVQQSSHGEIVPAASWNLMQRKPWTPKGRLAENFARAGEVYPHRLCSQGKCIGNGVEMVHGFGRGR